MFVPTLRLSFLASVLALGTMGCGNAKGESDVGKVEKSIAAPKTVAVTEVDVPVVLSLDGTLVADEDSRVTSVVAGRVVSVLVERGAVVPAGAPLVKLRDVDYRLAARGAQAALEQARARLGIAGDEASPKPESTAEVRAAQSDMQLAEQTLARAEELGKRGALSQQQLDEARARTTGARERYASALNGARASLAQLESATVALGQATTSAQEATVRAPFAGEIADRMVSVGEFVSPQTPLVTLVRTDPVRVELSVPQQHLASVSPGQTVEVSVDAFPGRVFPGTVRYVSASVSTSTRGLMVEAVIPNTDRTLRPGMFVKVRVETGKSARVPLVPAAAVLVEAGVSRVFVLRGGVVEERVVSVRERRGDSVVLEGAVTPGDAVAVERIDQLADGLHVTSGNPSAAPAKK